MENEQFELGKLVGQLETQIEGLNHTLQVQNVIIKELSNRVDQLQKELQVMQTASVKSSSFMAGALFVASAFGSAATYLYHYFTGN